MPTRALALIAAVLGAGALSIYLAATSMANRPAPLGEDGIVHVRSAHAFAETIDRLQRDVQGKGIMLFSVIDQAKLAANAGIKLKPSTLLLFGNPALGAQFLTSKAQAGLDWPVRLIVYEDAMGQVWASYTDFAWIARRHGISDRAAAFKMAQTVIASITASVAATPR